MATSPTKMQKTWGVRAAPALAVALLTAGMARAQTPIPPAPKDFAMAASQSDRYEILAADTAETQSRDPRVQAFAQMMAADHTRLSDSLRQATVAAGFPPPDPGLGSDKASLLAALQSLRGPAFDKAYAHQQVLAHTEALAVEQSFAAGGAEPHLKSAAASAVPVITAHLKMAEDLSAALGPS